MLVEEIAEIQINKTSNSRINQVDWDNLPFGKVFSDHMFVMDYKDGQWQNPQIQPYGDLSMSPATSVLHYGQSCFEGMKAHKNEEGDILLFRPYENASRFNVSADRMCMPTIPEDFFVDRNARSIENFYVCGHSTEMRVSDILAMGFDIEDLDGLDSTEYSVVDDEAEFERRGYSVDDSEDENRADQNDK